MKYEVMALEEKTVVGLTARTSNGDENMTQVIGALWQQFFGKGIYESIPNKINDKSIGLYSDYESDKMGAYDITVCCEVKEANTLSQGVVVRTIPAGKYAKFIVVGHMQEAVGEFWQKLWSLPLDRKYSCDFEEYQSGGDMENAEIHIYISLN